MENPKLNVIINIIDADTMRTIEKDFSVEGYPASMDTYIIRNGCESIFTEVPNILWLLDDKQVASYGYTSDGFERDRMYQSEWIDYGDGSYMLKYPRVFNIRLKKIAE